MVVKIHTQYANYEKKNAIQHSFVPSFRVSTCFRISGRAYLNVTDGTHNLLLAQKAFGRPFNSCHDSHKSVPEKCDAVFISPNQLDNQRGLNNVSLHFDAQLGYVMCEPLLLCQLRNVWFFMYISRAKPY